VPGANECPVAIRTLKTRIRRLLKSKEHLATARYVVISAMVVLTYVLATQVLLGG